MQMRRDFNRSAAQIRRAESPTFVNVAGVCLLPGLATLLLLTRWGGGGLLASVLFLGGGSLSSWGLAPSGRLLLGSFGRHLGGDCCLTRNAKNGKDESGRRMRLGYRNTGVG